LLAAKVLVLSRLIHKKLSLGSKSLSYLDTLRGRLARLRRKLLLKIDSVFQSLEITEKVLIEAMCAFSLATSSSPTDILRYYHHIRAEALNRQAQNVGNIEMAMIQALQYCIKTLQDTKAYIPGKLAQALQAIKSTPIFRSKDLHSRKELNLDVHERWIDEDIKIFIPYIGDVEVKRAEAGRASNDWAKHAFTSFSNILQGQLKSTTDTMIITRLRKQILRLWVSTPQRSLGVDTSDVLEGLRDTFNAQIIRLIWSQTMSLQKTAITVEKTLHNWQSRNSDNIPSLWASSIVGWEISNGGKAFGELVRARFNGRDETLEVTSLEYKAWLQRVEHLGGMIKEVRETKWDDMVDELEDDDDILGDKQILLSEDDPRLLEDEFHKALRRSFTSLQDSIEVFAVELDKFNHGEQAAYLLRVWKEIESQLPSSYKGIDIGISAVLKLQEIVAAVAVHGPLSVSEKRIKKSDEQLVVRPLWEGNPELPVFPSSWVFRLLHDLVHSMTVLGSDIWSPQATDILKKQIRGSLALHIQRELSPASVANGVQSGGVTKSNPQLEADGTGPINGELSPDGPMAIKRVNNDNRIQALFDILYLDMATTCKSDTVEDADDDLVRIIKGVEMESGIDQGGRRRMRRNAEDYWKRTLMLFGLIA
jgi:conserved oligomeric Golgi complex subunit 1